MSNVDYALVARGYPAGLVGVVASAARRLAVRVPLLAPVLTPRRHWE